MMIVKMTFNAHPEKHLEVLQTLLSLIESVREGPGCRSCCAFCGIDDKNQFSLLGEWETEKDMENHIQSYQFGVLLEQKHYYLNRSVFGSIKCPKPGGWMRFGCSGKKRADGIKFI